MAEVLLQFMIDPKSNESNKFFVVDSQGCASRVYNILTAVMTNIVVDKNTVHAKRMSICQIIECQVLRCFSFGYDLF